VCWYSNLCLLSQHILWPRDAGNKPCSRLAHRKTKLHFWPSLLILLVEYQKGRLVEWYHHSHIEAFILISVELFYGFYDLGINNMPPAVTQFLHFLI
jgi:hypothetical protein